MDGRRTDLVSSWGRKREKEREAGGQKQKEEEKERFRRCAAVMDGPRGEKEEEVPSPAAFPSSSSSFPSLSSFATDALLAFAAFLSREGGIRQKRLHWHCGYTWVSKIAVSEEWPCKESARVGVGLGMGACRRSFFGFVPLYFFARVFLACPPAVQGGKVGGGSRDWRKIGSHCQIAARKSTENTSTTEPAGFPPGPTQRTVEINDTYSHHLLIAAAHESRRDKWDRKKALSRILT